MLNSLRHRDSRLQRSEGSKSSTEGRYSRRLARKRGKPLTKSMLPESLLSKLSLDLEKTL